MAAIVLGKKCLLECDLMIVSGASFSCRFEWTKRQPDGTEVPADLEGASALCQIRVENDGQIVLDASPYVSFTEGVVAIDITPEATAGVPEGKYLWDVMVTDAEGSTARLAAGKATFIDPISEEG